MKIEHNTFGSKTVDNFLENKKRKIYWRKVPTESWSKTVNFSFFYFLFKLFSFEAGDGETPTYVPM
ncbi:MAG: hypothetical protein P4L63_01570 [Candidatus Pacebacteria bacterium]|nr:hypothetical protein [Candidatus Paceibacterota bacterium]